MKMKGADMWIGMTVLTVAVSLLAIPTSHAQKAAGNFAGRLAGGLWPRSSPPQLGDFPRSSGRTGLRGGEEPSYRAAIRRLLIRAHAGFS